MPRSRLIEAPSRRPVLAALAVPCHRVVGSDGALTERKKALLERERENA
jgi:hypothetical protein